MSDSNLARLKIGFIGTGNLTQSIIRAFLESKTLRADQIFGTNRSSGKLNKVRDLFGITTLKNNEEIVELCDVIFIAVKPQDITEAIEPIGSTFTPNQIVVSLAAGVSLNSLKALMPAVRAPVRMMINMPVAVQRAIVGCCWENQANSIRPTLEALFKSVGTLVVTEEGEAFEALTVASSGGPGFVFELMQYWIEWLEEHHFDSEVARKMTVETFLGASLMADRQGSLPIVDLQNQVVSKKGITQAGLDSMRELEIERGLRISFEKAVLRDRELGKKI